MSTLDGIFDSQLRLTCIRVLLKVGNIYSTLLKFQVNYSETL